MATTPSDDYIERPYTLSLISICETCNSAGMGQFYCCEDLKCTEHGDGEPFYFFYCFGCQEELKKREPEVFAELDTRRRNRFAKSNDPIMGRVNISKA